MQPVSNSAPHRSWFGPDSTGWRRSLLIVPFLVLGMLFWAGVSEWTRADGFALLFVAMLLVVVGLIARSWLVLLTSFVATVLLMWTVEISTYLWLGSHEWAHRNAEHWQGNEPAYWKLIGQLIEYPIFVLLFALPLVALGVLVGRWLVSDRHDRRERGHSEA